MWLKLPTVCFVFSYDHLDAVYAFDYAKNIHIDDILKEHVGGLYHMRHIEIRVFICTIMGKGYLPDLSPEEEDIFRIYK